MVVIKGYADPFWHESNLILLLLSKGAMEKKYLFEELPKEQKKRVVIREKGYAHSQSSYRYWINALMDQGIINKSLNTFQLTPLGKWITRTIDTNFHKRYGFIQTCLCPECSESGHLVFLKPLPGTLEQNAKNKLFIDMECVRCGNRLNRVRITDFDSIEDFIGFYKEAAFELRGIVD